MSDVFINKAFDITIKEYLKLQKESNELVASSFSIGVLKMLANIYGEVDIINPYIIRNEKSFQQNIMKFGYSFSGYEEFVSNFLNYFEIEEENKNLALKKPNPYFVEVQKNLIDMFKAKKECYHISEDEEMLFFELLYTTKSTNPLKLSYNYLTASDVFEVENYFFKKSDEEEKPEPPKKSNVLNIEAYEILNYSLTDIANMDSDSVDEVNKNVYSFFKINEDEENKADLLNDAIENYKKYNSRLTSGNGYVDILLVMGIVVTGILVLTVASFIIF